MPTASIVNRSHALSMAVGLVLSILGIAQSAETAFELVSLTNVWRYEQSGTDLGDAWKAPNYDDSNWASGAGVLAYEDGTQAVIDLTRTRLTRTDTNGLYIVTYYFRTHFTAPELPGHYYLLASNLVDDGAVFYLNGQEWFRYNMPSGPVTASTLALQWIDSSLEGKFTLNELPQAGLRAGDNVLAVEVHQPYITSSDVTFGMVLTAMPQVPITFLEHPAHLTKHEGAAAELHAVVSGGTPSLQWLKDGQPIPGATNATLSWAQVNRTNAGLYAIVAANASGSVTSQWAALTVILDTSGPFPESASQTSQPGTIRLEFSDAINPETATNPASYRIYRAGIETSPVTNVLWSGWNSVNLQTSLLQPGATYWVRIHDVQDYFGNPIEPGSGVAIAQSVTNIPLGMMWKYNDSGIDPGAAWHTPEYDDSAWASGRGILYNDVNLSLQPPGVLRTLIAVTNNTGSFWTHYFRLHFTNAISPLNARLQIRTYVDDGAVFYLNGTRIGHINMPGGSVTHTTRAQASGTEGRLQPVGVVATVPLRAGENVLAAEVHQFSLTSPDFPDISFDAEMEVTAESFLDMPAQILTQPLDAIVAEGATALFRAQVAGAERIFWTKNGQPIPGIASNSLSVTASVPEAGAVMALVASNSFGMVTSRTARLTVRSDIMPPQLLWASMGTNLDQVVLKFSEPVSPASAGVLSHYSITNMPGEPLEILGVSVTNGTNVILSTLPRSPEARYGLRIQGVTDASANANPVREVTVALESEHLIFGYDWAWKYHDGGTNIGTAWREPDFDDSTWPMGPGLLGFEDHDIVLPHPILTMLPPPEFRGPTYYFRTRFNYSSGLGDMVVRLRHIIDDGAVFYLNGREVHRIGMPPTHEHGTLTTRSVTDGQVEGPFAVPADALLPGINTLAVEVHQVSTVSADSVFGMELVKAYPGSSVEPFGPALEMVKKPQGFELWWPESDAVLEVASEITGPWELAPAPTMPYVVSTSSSARFFRLRVVNP